MHFPQMKTTAGSARCLEISRPHFEVNTRTVDILFQLAQSSEARCRDTALLSEDLKQKASEYQAEGAHIRDVLLQGRLKNASDYLSALVDNAMVLGVRDTSLGSFMPAVNNLTNELLEEEKDINKTIKSQSVESAKAEERMLNMDFVRAKAKELSSRRERAEAKLVSRNMDKSLTHQAIVQLSEEATALKQEIIPLKNKLKPYMDLSPVKKPGFSCYSSTNRYISKQLDCLYLTVCSYPSNPQQSPSLAQVKIEEAKRELVSIVIVYLKMDERCWLSLYFNSNVFPQSQAAIDSQLQMNMDFKL
ncbi:hypothetical protein F7725_006618 [Dissostichus mawsoni]|uniref:Uncharacterized protein n=1 Tax=Dissostichus mawsoni TaxID=36200 RepID=A0A7J5XUE3_DISMA|nr:hypothetical protein F7725_006618 [Dissostichus mawsoni]